MVKATERPISVLLVIGQPGIGGITEGILPYVEVANPEEMKIAVTIPPGPAAEQFRAAGARVFEIPIKHALHIMAAPKIAMVARRIRPDLVRSHMVIADPPGLVAGRVVGRPVVKSFHGWLRTDKALNDAAYCRLDRWTVRAAYRVTVETEWAKRELINKIGADARKIVVLPPSVGTRFRAQAFRREMQARGVDAGYPTFIIVGRLTRQKGQAYAIEALARMVNTRPSARLVLVGEGPDRASLAELAVSLGVAHAVSFLGERRDVPALLARADVAIVPSLWEEFGLANVEAMAAGLPVIASLVDGIPEIVRNGRTGLLVPPKDPPALAAAMVALADNRTVAMAFGAAGQKRVEELYSPGRFYSRTLELYRDVRRTWSDLRSIGGAGER